MNEWQSIYDYLKKEGYSDIEIEKAGMIKKKDRGVGFYDRFRNRVIFPLFDNSNRPMAFSGRLFEINQGENKDMAKYLNSPETILFNKSNILYAYNFAKNTMRKSDFSIVVEGQMDLLMCHQAGYTNTVASSGTSLTVGHLKLLKRFSDKMVLAFDGDEAGFKSACKASKLALLNNMEVRLMKIPNGMDPADLILNNKKEWKKSLKNAKHIIDFYLEKLIDEIKDRRKLGNKVQKLVLPYVALVKSEIEKANFVEGIAKKLEIPVQAIRSELNKIKIELPKDLKYDSNEMIDELIIREESHLEGKLERKNNIIRQLSGLYWWQKKIKKPILEMELFENNLINIAGDDVFQKILKLPEKIKNEIIFEAEIFYQDLEYDSLELKNDLELKIQELFLNLETILIESKIEKLILKIKEIKKDENEEDLEKIMKKYNKYLIKKDKLKLRS